IAGAKFLTQEERKACLAAMNPDVAAAAITSAKRAGNDTDSDTVQEIATLRGTDDVNSNENEKEASSTKDKESLSQQSGELTNTTSDAARTRMAIDNAAAAGAKVDASAVEKFEWREVRRGIFEVQVWLTGLAYLCMLNALYSFSLFLPTILRSMYPDVTPARLQLLSVPPYVPAAVMCVIVAVAADRARMRVPFMLVLLPISMVGYAILLATKNAQAKYAGVFLIALGVYPATPCVLSILPNNCSGHTKRATAVALQLAVANCAGFVATFIYQDKFAKQDQKPGHWVVLGSLILAEALLIAQMFYVRWENAARASGKRDHKVAAYEKLVAEGKTEAPIGDRSPTFRFVI
ncbi:unnamed protein product, partial [Tilletia controversa]